MSGADRAALAEEIVRRLAAALRGAQLYAAGHPLVARGITALSETLTLTLGNLPSVTIGIVGDDLVVGDYPIPRAAETMGELMRRLKQAGIERIVIQRGVETDEIERLVASVASGETGKDGTLGRIGHGAIPSPGGRTACGTRHSPLSRGRRDGRSAARPN